MRLPTLCLAAILHAAACGSDTRPAVKPAATAAPVPAKYPGGIKTALGVSSTRDFLADTVTAAADRQRLSADGFKIVRLDLLWQEVEPAPGVENYAAFDKAIADLNARGLVPLLILLYGNPAFDDAGATCPQPDMGVWACMGSDFGPFVRFAERTAKRYKGKVKLYEVWNEPNGWFRFWPRVEGGDPAAFARLTADTADAVHRACPACEVLSGGMVYLASPISLSQREFMQRMMAAVPDVFERIDGIGFHAYTFYPPVDPPELAANPVPGLFGQVPLDESLADVKAACNCDKPLWITETGWTAVGNLTQEERARYALRGFLLALTQGAKSWLWWSVRDYRAEKLVAPQEAHFGLLDTEGAPHPAYEALTKLIELAGDAVEVTDVRAEYGFAAPYAWAVRLTWPNGSTGEVLWFAGRGDAPPVPAALRGQAAVRLRDGQKVSLSVLDGDPVLVK